MHTLLAQIFEELEQHQISYCLLRGFEELEVIDDQGDIDLLVREDQLGRFQALAEQLHFVHLPSWGRAPHEFYIAYDEASDHWLKLDVVATIMYGNPIPAIKTDLADRCLARRRQRGSIYVPAPEDELVTLLLHCLLDKGKFAANRLERIKALRQEIVDESYLSSLLSAVWSADMNWSRLAALIDNGNWSAMLAAAPGVARRLSRSQRLKVASRKLSGRMLRKLDRFAGVLQPRSLTVALLAPDGGGKTTLAVELAKRFFLSSRYVYMGTNVEASTVGLPTTRWIQSQSRRPPQLHRLPVWLIARVLRFPNNALEQWYRYIVSYYHIIRGRLVLFDRYVYDAPGKLGRASLKSRVRRWVLSAIAPKPNLVVFLDAPGEVLFARKGEHTPAILEQQRQHYLSLQPYLPQMVVVDATNNADQVRRTVTSLIWRWYAKSLRRELVMPPSRG